MSKYEKQWKGIERRFRHLWLQFLDASSLICGAHRLIFNLVKLLLNDRVKIQNSLKGFQSILNLK